LSNEFAPIPLTKPKSEFERKCDEELSKVQADVYVSVVFERSPFVKFHKTIGPAKNAIVLKSWRYNAQGKRGAGVRGGAIYKINPDGGFETLYVVEPGTLRGDLPWPVKGYR